MTNKDPCFVPCDTDVLLDHDVIGARGDTSIPVKVDAKRMLKRRIIIDAPV